jgi:hypothetical protein
VPLVLDDKDESARAACRVGHALGR